MEPEPASQHGRFLPGTVFGKRYRIVGLLGRGGMGEIYRADDLELGQSVALKFLPAAFTADESALILLKNEVRIARQIAHPNVCRVYDLGEVEGQYFVSMEYVDGEDLAGLLRRIGRVPGEKARDMATQLAAGVAAAHELGVLHRDLKPANVMVDGRGRVRIMDFGLAGFADELRGREDLAGTLAYMAPEQLAGKGPTARSDVYALGLVMYELLTGRRAYESRDLDRLRQLQAEGPPPAPSSLVSDTDPIMERVVMSCLAYDPRERPGSGLAVARALPGGDPLAAAVAAGETPSPELVAAAGGRGAISIRTGILLLLVILAGFGAIAHFNDRTSLISLAGPFKPPVVLADRAVDMLDRLGYVGKASDRAYELYRNWDLVEHIAESDSSPGRWERLADSRPTAYGLWYRQAEEPMLPQNRLEARPSWSRPPHDEEGMVRLRLDQTGRLTWLEIVPPWREAASESAGPADWTPLFEMAEINRDAVEEAEPLWRPRLPVDRRQAWAGTHSHPDSLPFRIEAGSLNGRPVYFRVFDTGAREWLLADRAEEGGGSADGTLDRALSALATLVLLVILLGLPAFFGWRNIRAGRADIGSAIRFGLLGGALSLASGTLQASYYMPLDPAMERVIVGTGMSVFLGTVMGMGYLAAEPYLRRSWPDLLISWTRLMGGRYRDPRVGRDVLIGAGAAIAMVVMMMMTDVVPGWFGRPAHVPFTVDLDALAGGRFTLSWFLDPQFLLVSVVTVLIILFFLLVLRRRKPAVIVTLAVMLLTMINPGPQEIQSWGGAVDFLVACSWLILGLLILIRFGLLAYVSAFFFLLRLHYPLTFDGSAWYSGTGTVVFLVLAGISIYAFRIATTGRSRDLPGNLGSVDSRGG
jgi:serine/threonine-protein kinase